MPIGSAFSLAELSSGVCIIFWVQPEEDIAKSNNQNTAKKVKPKKADICKKVHKEYNGFCNNGGVKGT